MKKIKVLLFLLVVQLATVQLLGAQEKYEFVLTLTTLPEAKLGFVRHFTFPFLEGSSPLTQDNNIALDLTAELSPVSVNGLVDAVWTPIAFFQLAAGGMIGSGWKIKLFGKDLYGMGINRDDGSGYSEYSGSAFDGLLWKVKAGGVLQFDLAALIPGDWNHIVARTYHEINYLGYTAAGSGESWYFEVQDGENVNGFNYYGNLLIGYQMPIILDMVGILTEAELFLYDTPGRSNWGDDKIRWKFGLVGNVTYNENISSALIVQFHTVRNYLESDWKDLYYRNRTLNNSKPVKFAFYRCVLIASYKF